MEGGGQQVGVANVGLLARRHGVQGGDSEAPAALPVQDGGKDGGGVEPRVAKPVDGAAGGDQGGGLTIADQAVGIHWLTLQRHATREHASLRSEKRLCAAG